MRFMPQILANLFRPVPSSHVPDDPIRRELDAAVSAHERQAAQTQATIDGDLRSAIAEVLEKMEQAR